MEVQAQQNVPTMHSTSRSKMQHFYLYFWSSMNSPSLSLSRVQQFLHFGLLLGGIFMDLELPARTSLSASSLYLSFSSFFSLAISSAQIPTSLVSSSTLLMRPTSLCSLLMIQFSHFCMCSPRCSFFFSSSTIDQFFSSNCCWMLKMCFFSYLFSVSSSWMYEISSQMSMALLLSLCLYKSVHFVNLGTLLYVSPQLASFLVLLFVPLQQPFYVRALRI